MFFNFVDLDPLVLLFVNGPSLGRSPHKVHCFVAWHTCVYVYVYVYKYMYIYNIVPLWVSAVQFSVQDR